MDLPDSLPARMYLLAYDPTKGRLTSRGQLCLILRAAALADLALRGHLADQKGRVQAVGTSGATHDRVLDAVLEDIATAGRPRTWQQWVGRRTRKVRLSHRVRDQLAEARVLTVDQRRFLGLVRYQRITLQDTRGRQRLVDGARRTLHGGEPVTRIDPRDATIVALAAAGELDLLVNRSQRREFTRRLQALADQAGPASPVVPALRKALAAQRAANNG